jgi:hypothetical protein
MKLVKSKHIYSPQNYLELITGNCYIHKCDNDVEFIEKILEDEGYCLWSYPLNEIDHIVENEIPVVLVDCMIYNDDIHEFEHAYRWFEVDFDEEVE